MDPNAYAEFYPYTTPLITSLSWDPATESHTPFRATTHHVHQTWAKTFTSRPELYIRPQTLDELRIIVLLASRLRKHITVTGAGHSPSDLTLTSSWLVNLDDFRSIISADDTLVTVEAGIRLHQFLAELDSMGLTMPNFGSITDQSLAGAISTATHGSTLHHGLLSESVESITLMLASGDVITCSLDEHPDLFRAALVSLGALGIITHVSFRAVPSFSVHWTQSIVSMPNFLFSWSNVWLETEFVRCWWFPYSGNTIVWQGEKTTAPLRARPKSWYGGATQRWLYEALLYVATFVPSAMPTVERFVFRMQYGSQEGVVGEAIEKSYDALTMDCLFPQLVNEWSLPLHRGPEALTRLEHWLHGRDELARIPVPNTGVYVHAPIEVRVSNTMLHSQHPFLDSSCKDEPTLYLNATLYRPFLKDIPGWKTYYRAFEHLMMEMGGKPHWAKNWVSPGREDVEAMYGEDLESWREVRRSVDPEGLFAGGWLRRNVLPLEEDVGERQVTIKRGQRQEGWVVEYED